MISKIQIFKGAVLALIIFLSPNLFAQASATDWPEVANSTFTLNGHPAGISLQLNSAKNRVAVNFFGIDEKVKMHVVQVCKNKKNDAAFYKISDCEEFGDSWLENISNESLNRNVCLTDGPANYTVYAFIKTVTDRKISVQADISSTGSTKGVGSQSCIKIGDNLTAEMDFLESSPYVQASAPEIIRLAESITQGASSDLQKSRAIYTWITNNIAYDISIIEIVNGSVKFNLPPAETAIDSLKKKMATCTGYSFLNAALHRAVGIRAKAVLGILKADGQSIEHAWNEVYLNSAWRSQDSTTDSGYYEIRGSRAVFVRDAKTKYFNNQAAFANTYFKKKDYKF